MLGDECLLNFSVTRQTPIGLVGRSTLRRRPIATSASRSDRASRVGRVGVKVASSLPENVALVQDSPRTWGHSGVSPSARRGSGCLGHGLPLGRTSRGTGAGRAGSYRADWRLLARRRCCAAGVPRRAVAGSLNGDTGGAPVPRVTETQAGRLCHGRRWGQQPANHRSRYPSRSKTSTVPSPVRSAAWGSAANQASR